MKAVHSVCIHLFVPSYASCDYCFVLGYLRCFMIWLKLLYQLNSFLPCNRFCNLTMNSSQTSCIFIQRFILWHTILLCYLMQSFILFYDKFCCGLSLTLYSLLSLAYIVRHTLLLTSLTNGLVPGLESQHHSAFGLAPGGFV